MRLKNGKTINEMAGKRLYSIYADYVDGTPKEYEGKIKEYIILGTSKEADSIVMLWDIDKQKVREASREDIHRNLNMNGIKTGICWGDVYAYAFTKETAEKCLKGLQASIDADYERKQKWEQIETRSYTFTLDKLKNSGIRNLVYGGVEAIDVTPLSGKLKPVMLRLPDDYEKFVDQRGLQDLWTLGFISTGKHVFESTGNDICNPGEKGELVPERDITILLKVSEDERGRKDPVKIFRTGDKCYTNNVKWLKLRVYIKLPYNNYASIKKFGKFFNVFDLQKVN